jgi:hypothetical protein
MSTASSPPRSSQPVPPRTPVKRTPRLARRRLPSILRRRRPPATPKKRRRPSILRRPRPPKRRPIELPTVRCVTIPRFTDPYEREALPAHPFDIALSRLIK